MTNIDQILLALAAIVVVYLITKDDNDEGRKETA